MARDIFQVYDFTRYIFRKQRGLFLSIPMFNNFIIPAQMDCINDYWNEYGKNNQIHDAIRPLRKYQPFTSATDGKVTFQSDYMHLLGTPVTVYGSAVTDPRFVNEDELSSALNSELRPCDMAHPVLVDAEDGFNVYPQQTQTGFYYYLRYPANPVLAVTQVGREINYDPTNSVQLELNQAFWDNVIAKLLAFFGLNMSEREVSGFANQYKAETT